MRKIDTVLLSSGGMRSLVAAATLDRAGLAWLYVHDGRVASLHDRAMFVKQSEHFEAEFRSELKLTHLHRDRAGMEERSPLSTFQLVSGAAAEAVRLGANRLVWPVTAGEDLDLVSRVTESLVLLEHVVKLETGAELAIETPLMDMTPRQVVEVGEQLGVNWRLSRSCRMDQGPACGACAGCARRAEAFAAAHVIDPLTQAAPARTD